MCGDIEGSQGVLERADPPQPHRSETERKRVASVARGASKAAKSAASQAQFEAWQQCHDGCCCGPNGAPLDECPVGHLILCAHCGDLKRAVCRKKACKDALAEEGGDEEEGGEEGAGEA